MATVLEITADEYMAVSTIEKFPIQLKVKAKEAVKYFEVGESVRIIEGVHSGAAGLITSIINDKHAVITLEGGRGELKILLFNLRNKE